MAVTKSQPSRAALAPPKPAARAKTRRAILPTTLATTKVEPLTKPSGLPHNSLSDSAQARPTYPRTHRRFDLPSANRSAPVIDVVTYRESLANRSRIVRNVSTTPAVQAAPAGTWLATYQQLVRQNQKPPKTAVKPVSRRRTAKR